MRGFRGVAIGACLCLLVTSSSARAQWLDWGYVQYGPVYYVPAYYYYPVYPDCVPVMPAAPLRPTTTPQRTAAPKKTVEKVPVPTTKEPPVMGEGPRKGPVITESRSSGTAPPLRTRNSERCKVGFWNLTGHDVALTVDGQQRLLPKDRAVTLELARSFVWQADRREAVTERVPPDEAFHEVILRQ